MSTLSWTSLSSTRYATSYTHTHPGTWQPLSFTRVSKSLRQWLCWCFVSFFLTSFISILNLYSTTFHIVYRNTLLQASMWELFPSSLVTSSRPQDLIAVHSYTFHKLTPKVRPKATLSLKTTRNCCVLRAFFKNSLLFQDPFQRLSWTQPRNFSLRRYVKRYHKLLSVTELLTSW